MDGCININENRQIIFCVIHGFHNMQTSLSDMTVGHDSLHSHFSPENFKHLIKYNFIRYIFMGQDIFLPRFSQSPNMILCGTNQCQN